MKDILAPLPCQCSFYYANAEPGIRNTRNLYHAVEMPLGSYYYTPNYF